MRLADLKLDTDYAYDHWHTTPDRVQVTELRGVGTWGGTSKVRNAVPGRMLDRFTGEWRDMVLTLQKIIGPWDDPKQVELRRRVAAMDAEAGQIRRALEAFGLVVHWPGTKENQERRPEAFVRAYLATEPTKPPRITVEIHGDAFREHVLPVLQEWDEARADREAG